MKLTSVALLAGLLLPACGKTSRDAPESSRVPVPGSAPSASSTATARPLTSTPTPAVASAASAKSSDGPTAASGAPSASAAAASPCPDGARKDEKARYCITLPAKILAISYTGDKPEAGIEEEVEDVVTHNPCLPG